MVPVAEISRKVSKWWTPPLSVQEGELDEGFALGDCRCPARLPRAEDRTQHIWDGFGGLTHTRWWWLQWQWLVTTMTTLIGSTQAFKGSTISLDHPWLIDLSHLLLVVSASSNVVVYAVQVLLSLLLHNHDTLTRKDFLGFKISKSSPLSLQGGSYEVQKKNSDQVFIINYLEYRCIDINN